MESTASSPEPEFGPFQEGDEALVSVLVGRTSGVRTGLRLRETGPEYYRWMYMQNPAGRAIVHSARVHDRMVASFAIAPRIFVIDGERLVVGKTMDMFTDPQWQGRGLIRRCTQAVFEEALSRGIRGWYVTPSENSYPIFTGRWGYREEFSLGYRLRPLTPGGWGDRLRLPSAYTAEAVDRFDHSADVLWREIAGEHRVAQVRDSTYLNWRYVANPDHYDLLTLRRDGRLVGIVVLGKTLRRRVPVGELMEIIHPADDEETLRVLVKAAAMRAESRGCVFLQAWTVPDTRLDKRLHRAGLRWRRGTVKFLLSPGFPGAASGDPDAWLLSQGDGNDV